MGDDFFDGADEDGVTLFKLNQGRPGDENLTAGGRQERETKRAAKCARTMKHKTSAGDEDADCCVIILRRGHGLTINLLYLWAMESFRAWREGFEVVDRGGVLDHGIR